MRYLTEFRRLAGLANLAEKQLDPAPREVQQKITKLYLTLEDFAGGNIGSWWFDWKQAIETAQEAVPFSKRAAALVDALKKVIEERDDLEAISRETAAACSSVRVPADQRDWNLQGTTVGRLVGGIREFSYGLDDLLTQKTQPTNWKDWLDIPGSTPHDKTARELERKYDAYGVVEATKASVEWYAAKEKFVAAIQKAYKAAEDVDSDVTPDVDVEKD